MVSAPLEALKAVGWILNWTMRDHQEGNTDKGTNDFKCQTFIGGCGTQL